ncbi:MAG: radical SAM protein [Anaerolineae bacterium]|nr:radical SAM protein [Anaerolineae bacterium]MDW8098507.1 radical SAM protein [Anaerolineae bacterium]
MITDLQDRVRLLSEASQYDVCLEAGRPMPLAQPERHPCLPPGFAPEHHISHVNAGGRRMPVLKILQTSACEKDCFYCPFRAGRDFRRASLSPDDLAYAFDQMARAGLVEGLFLSSGIVGTARTMDRMIATAELIRRKYGFRGYIHLKLLPGAEPAHIERAIALADRVSVNLEAPNPQRLARLAPHKEFTHALMETLRHAARMIREAQQAGRPLARAGTVTQFVVGPAGESDRELLTTVQSLYDAKDLTRAYYSAFSPIPDTPLEDVAPTSPWRAHRLYQGDFLLRHYGFRAEELIYDEMGNLRLDQDPKLAWALAHPDRFPVEVNRASRFQLLRVPGIGPRAADRILTARRQGKIRELGQLRRLGVDIRRAAPFVLIAGRAPAIQLPLFPA